MDNMEEAIRLAGMVTITRNSYTEMRRLARFNEETIHEISTKYVNISNEYSELKIENEKLTQEIKGLQFELIELTEIKNKL
jgi:ribosome biogenesis protein Nip4